MTAQRGHIRLLRTALLLFFVIGCGRRADGPNAPSSSVPPAEAGAQAKKDVQPNDAVVKLESGMMANIKIEQLSEKVLPLTFTATGKVNFNEDQMARILAPVAGQI